MAGAPEDLLNLARQAVLRPPAGDVDPSGAAELILSAWEGHGDEILSVDTDFQVDARTGVEILAFAARSGGGVVLRLPGEIPDSFEPVALAGPGPFTSDEVRRAFFERLAGPS